MPKFRTLTGTFAAYVRDGSDPDITPDRDLMNGRITFTPVFTGGVIAFPRLSPPEFAHPKPINALIVDGEVKVEVGGSETEAPVIQPLSLMVTVDDEATQVWSWRAEFDDVLIGSSDEYVNIPTWSFRVPDGTGPVDLTELVPLKSTGTVDVTKGPRGAGLQTITAVDGQLVFEYTDGQESTVPIPEAVQGPQGEPGPAGADGEQGPEGPQGPPGETPDLLVGNITDATPTGKNLMLAATEGAARNALGLAAGATASNGPLTELQEGTSNVSRVWTAANLATHAKAVSDKAVSASLSAQIPFNTISEPPVVVSESRILVDPDGRMVDGARFFTLIEVGSHEGAWLDQWYGYVAGHDSPDIHLATAPDPAGPWTLRNAVISVPTGVGIMKDPNHQVHVSSPDAYWSGGKIHLLYHGPAASNLLEQPTSLATSVDGVNFTRVSTALPTDYANAGSPYRTSTSYARTYLDGGIRHAIWQGTTGRNSVVDGYSYAPMPCGHAISGNGVSYQMLAPILTSGNKDQGLLAPGLTKVGSQWLVVGVYRTYNGSGQTETTRMYVGDSLDRLRPIGDIALGGLQNLTSPTLLVRSGRLCMIGGNRLTSGGTPAITYYELGWR